MCSLFCKCSIFFLYFEGENQRRLRGQAHTTSRGEIQPAENSLLILLIITLITQKSRVAGPLPLAGLEARGGRDISGQLGIKLIFNITQPAPDTSSSTKHPRPLYMAGPIDTTRRANAAAHAPVPFTYLSHKQYYYLARR